MINGDPYSGWIGEATKLELILLLPGSLLSSLRLNAAGPSNSGETSPNRAYAFDPSGNGQEYALYADSISANTLSFNFSLSDSLQLTFDRISVGFTPLSTVPSREQLKAHLTIDDIKLTRGQGKNAEILIEAGTGNTTAIDLELDLNSSNGADVSLELNGLRLGSALIGTVVDLTGKVALHYGSSEKILDLSGKVNVAGMGAQFAATYDIASTSLRSLQFALSSDTVLTWGDDLRLKPGNFLFEYQQPNDPSLATNAQFHLATQDSQLQIGTISVQVEGDLYASLLADISGQNQFQLERGSLRLADTLRLPLGELQLEIGKGSRLEIGRDNQGKPSVAISGSVQLAGLPDSLNGLSFSVPETNPIRWTDGAFSVNGRLDLPSITAGPILVGDDAHISLNGDQLTIDPDLKIDASLYGLLLKPIAEPINTLLMPLLRPMVDLVDDEIPLPMGLGNTLEPQWWWPDFLRSARKSLDQNLIEMSKGLIALLESSPGRIDSWKGDSQLQLVDVIDFGLYQLWKLAQTGGPSLEQLSSLLGIDPAVLKNLRGAPQPQFANSLELINRIGALAQQIQSADPGKATGLIDLPNLFLAFSINDTSTVSGLISDSIQNGAKSIQVDAPDSLLTSLLKTGEDFKQLQLANNKAQKQNAAFEIQASPLFTLPIFDDWTGTLKALLNGKPFDLVELGISAEARAQLSYNQIINLMPLIGIPLPVTVGFNFNLDLEMNALLGLTTTGSALSNLTTSLINRIGTVDDWTSAGAGLVSAMDDIKDKLIFPSKNGIPVDGMGLYLSHPDDAPLLSINPELRFQAGVDYGWIGARAYAGLGANLDLSLKPRSGSSGAGKLYFNAVYDTISKLVSGSSKISLEDLTGLFNYDLKAYLPWGVEPRLPVLGWVPNLPYITGQIPLLELNSSSQAYALAGPVGHSSVLLDLRHYEAGQFMSSGNLMPGPGEPTTTTDDAGGFHLEPPTDLTSVGNGDGLMDYRDGMVLVGSHDPGTGSIHLRDSITGLDLGMPLVGLPSSNHQVNASILSTLKYTTLLRWSPEKIISTPEGDLLLSPEVINAIIPKLLKAPAGIEDDSFNPYRALLANAEQRDQAINTLRFSYQQLFVVRTIEELLQRLELDYTSADLWRITGRELDPSGVDQPGITAYSAWGFALLNLFGYTSTPWREAPLGPSERFDPSRADQLELFFAEILAGYPTKGLLRDDASRQLFGHATWAPGTPSQPLASANQSEFIAENTKLRNLIQNQYGPSLHQLSLGLAALLNRFGEQFDAAIALSDSLDTGGTELLIPAIAGIKRQTFSNLIPDLLSQALDPAIDDHAFQDWSRQALGAPLLVDARDRLPDYLLKIEPAQVQGNIIRLRVQLSQRDDPNKAAVAPDYGLNLRYRLGGSARLGVDYERLDGSNLPLLRVEPGSSEATLSLRLNPASLRTSNPLVIQCDLLGADSGFAADPASCVAAVSLGTIPQALPLQARPSFQTQTSTISGVRGQVDQLRLPLQPQPGELLQVRDFDPDEGDVLEVDPLAVLMLRRRTFLPAANLATTQAALEQAWADHLKLKDADLAVVAGVLVDRPSQTPLALVSTTADNGSDVAWSQVMGGAQLRFASQAASQSPGALTLGTTPLAAGSSLNLNLVDSRQWPWAGATSLDLWLDGAPAGSVMNWPGRPAADPLGYSRSPALTVQLGSLGQGGAASLRLRQVNGPGEIPLQVVAEASSDTLQLLWPDGRPWAQLHQPELLAADLAPQLSYQPLDGASAPSKGASLRLGALSRRSSGASEMDYEASWDGGLSWQATTSDQRDLDPGRYGFRAIEKLADGTRLLSSPVQVVIGADGLLQAQTQAQESLVGSAFLTNSQALDPSRSYLGSWSIGNDRLTGIRLDRFGAGLADGPRQLKVGLELLREASLASQLSFCLMDTSTGALLDPLSGLDLANWGETSRWRQQVGASGLPRLVAQQGTVLQADYTMGLAAGIDWGRCALVPVLQVPEGQAHTYGGAASLNDDGANHLVVLGANCLGFEDLAGGGDNDFNDLILRLTSFELAQASVT